MNQLPTARDSRRAFKKLVTVGVLAALTVCATAVGLPRSRAQGAPVAAADGWSRVTPQSLGIDGARLEAIDADIGQGRYALVDSLLVARCGAIVFDHNYDHDYAAIYGAQARQESPLSPRGGGPYNYFDSAWHPYLPGTHLHTTQSMSKSVTSVIFGVAMQHGDFKASLDTPVLNYFKDKPVRYIDARKRRLTLRHVLTMTSGLDWPAHGGYTDPQNASTLMEASKDWVQFTIDRPMAHEPGSTFVYSDGDTELLAYIFQKETGQDLAQYAEKFLFAPLGIHDTYWKRTPLGVVNTEGGLYLRTEDMAKIGLLYLHDGVWAGRQIVPASWVRESLRPAVDVGGGRQYGFQWWLEPQGPGNDFIWAAHGFGGQGLLVDGKRNLIVVIMSWHIPEEQRNMQKEVLGRIVEATSEGGCPNPAAATRH